MKRKLGAVLFVIYAIVAITVTVLLLSYNEYNISQLGDYTIYIANNDALEPEYKQGSILLIKETNDKHVQVGDELFLYKVINSQEFEVVTRTLEEKSQQGRHVVYGVNEGETYDTNYFIGKADDTIVIEGPWGTILSILESKWGYLFCIVIVSLLLFLQEVFDLIIEIKYGGKKSGSDGTAKATKAKKVTAKSAGTVKATARKTTAKTATRKSSTAKSSTDKTGETVTKKVATTETTAKAEVAETEVKEEV